MKGKRHISALQIMTILLVTECTDVGFEPGPKSVTSQAQHLNQAHVSNQSGTAFKPGPCW